MFKCSQQRTDQKKKILDKTGEINVVLDLAISARKCPKIVTQEEEKIYARSLAVFFKTTLGFFTHFRHHLSQVHQTED